MFKAQTENNLALQEYQRALVWDKDTFLLELNSAINKKHSISDSASYDENWLHIWCRGGNIYPAFVEESLFGQKFSSQKFQRIVITLDNGVSNSPRPCFELSQI
jgi:hypothetical protein